MRVNELLPMDEIYAQGAEEAAELAQAFLKLRRALTGLNPTPVTVDDAWQDLMEEIADVMVCINQINGVNWAYISEIMTRKLGRWEGRLEAR